MKCIVLFGAGKSATVLIDYLKKLAASKLCHLIVADQHAKPVKQKTGSHTGITSIQLDISNATDTKALIQQADAVISLLPPALHASLAEYCILFHKHFLTASYIDPAIRSMEKDISYRRLLFLCEMGLDPGIDHMSAMKLINQIKAKGGNITSFQSYCGGLVAPETDTNPWHYKVSWNPRNIVLAGKNGATYKLNGKEYQVNYEDLFSDNQTVEIPSLGNYAFYPNRDSLLYAGIYQLQEAHTFMRTTLRHPAFCLGWKNIVHLKLTDEEKVYATDGLSFAAFFNLHQERFGLTGWLNETLSTHLTDAKKSLEQLTDLLEKEAAPNPVSAENEATIFTVNEKGELAEMNVQKKTEAAADSLAAQVHETNLFKEQLMYLGLYDEAPINQGLCSAADVLQLLVEKKLLLLPGDKDMVVMMHEIAYELQGEQKKLRSCLIVKGDDNRHTAMAKTVGLPLGIAAKLLLEGKLKTTGLQIPTLPALYEPVLKELEKHGIKFIEY